MLQELHCLTGVGGDSSGEICVDLMVINWGEKQLFMSPTFQFQQNPHQTRETEEKKGRIVRSICFSC